MIIPECLVYILGKFECFCVERFWSLNIRGCCTLLLYAIIPNTPYTLPSNVIQCILSQSYYNLILHCKLFFGGGGGSGLCCLILPFSYSGYLSITRTNRHSNGANWFKYEVSRNVKENVKFDPAMFWSMQV